MAVNKPLVLILGATGYTGKSVVEGLLNSGNFRVAALVRPSSLSKPAIEILRAAGVEIRQGDVTDPQEKLKAALTGVDTVISAVHGFVIPAQRGLFAAAKEAGVRRVVPCDWATPGAQGVQMILDTKLAVREYVKELGVGYTFIDVGWWMSLFLPLPVDTPVPPTVKATTWMVYAGGDTPLLLTDQRRIGLYVARIIADERTLNQAVIIWEDVATQNEAYALAERFSGEGEVLKAKRVDVSAEELEKARKAAHEALAKDPTDMGAVMRTAATDFAYSMHILKENTLENAKKLGYLDVHELYPDLPKFKFEDFAKEFYTWENPGAVYVRDGMKELFEKL